MLITFTNSQNTPSCYVICRVTQSRPAYGGIALHYDPRGDTTVEGKPTTILVQTESDILALAETFGMDGICHDGTDIEGCRNFLDFYAGRLFIEDPGYFD